MSAPTPDDEQLAEPVHQELLDRLTLLAAAEERYAHVAEFERRRASLSVAASAEPARR